MALKLSSADTTALMHASTVLLAPFAYDDNESWRCAAGRAVEACVGGDASAFVVPGGEPYLAASQNVLRALQTILPPPDWIIQGLTVRRRQLGLDVIGWDDAFDTDAVRRTSFYNDVARPARLLAPLMMVADTAADVVPATLSVYFTDERSAQQHAPRRKELLRLLFPAFAAGLKNYYGFRRFSVALASVAENAAIGVLFSDAQGHLRENDFLRRLMECDPERDRVRTHAAQTIRAIVGMPAFRGSSMSRRMDSEIRTQTARYRVAATFLGEWSLDSFQVVAIVERINRRPIAASELAARFFLTRREVEIAQLLRAGCSSGQIAADLGISVNTARRHVENVLRKLDVHSRSAAAAKLFGD